MEIRRRQQRRRNGVLVALRGAVPPVAFRVAAFQLVVQTLFYGAPWAAPANHSDWPRTAVTASEDRVTLSQPQVETWDGETIHIKCAVAVVLHGSPTATIGTVQLRARTVLDRGRRMVTITELRVPALRFPVGESEIAPIQNALEGSIKGASLEIPLDELTSTMVESCFAIPPSTAFEEPALRLIVRQQPAILLVIDGEPRMRSLDDNGAAQLCLNSQWPLLRAENAWWLLASGEWWMAPKLGGSWTCCTGPPEQVIKACMERGVGGLAAVRSPTDERERTPTTPAEILVRYEPTELIATDGEPAFEPIGAQQLWGCSNANLPLFRGSDGGYFLLVAGRWWTSDTIGDVGWTRIDPGALPEAFKMISRDFPWAGALAHLRETLAQREAVHSCAIPAEVEISRTDALALTPFGAPLFQSQSASPVAWSLHASKPVLRVTDQYFCCDRGAWWAAPEPSGKWTPARALPNAISSAAVTSPIGALSCAVPAPSTGDRFAFRYTAGFDGSFVQSQVAVYGTGSPMIGASLEFSDALPGVFGSQMWWNPWTCQWWSGCETAHMREARLGKLPADGAVSDFSASTFRPDAALENFYVGLDGRVYARRGERWLRATPAGDWTELGEHRSTMRVLDALLAARDAATIRRQEFESWLTGQSKLDGAAGATSSMRGNSMRAGEPRVDGFRSQALPPAAE